MTLEERSILTLSTHQCKRRIAKGAGVDIAMLID